MTKKGTWQDRLNATRVRPASDPDGSRLYESEFASDIRRVVTCSAFRRLQDKTQVFPLEEHDFVRTRLTHSMEVAAIGDQIAASVRAILRQREMDPGELTIRLGGENRKPCTLSAIQEVVRVACLLHDIGNPPFGHAGERAIHEWAESQKADLASGFSNLSEVEQSDFLRFDGNAQTFRIVARLQHNGKPQGLNLTAATLCAIGKYPWQVSACPEPEKNKAGHMVTETKRFHAARELCGLQGITRHPLSYLVEAADDIAYSLADLEDGLKKRSFALEELIEKLAPLDCAKPLLDQLTSRRKLLREGGLLSTAETNQVAFQHLRGMATGQLVGQVANAFVDHLETLFGEGLVEHNGFPRPLLDLCAFSPMVDVLQVFAKKKVYRAPAVLVREHAGTRVIKEILNIFSVHEKLRAAHIGPLVDPADSGPTSQAYLLRQRAVDYVCGMTDGYAITLHRRLTGITL